MAEVKTHRDLGFKNPYSVDPTWDDSVARYRSKGAEQQQATRLGIGGLFGHDDRPVQMGSLAQLQTAAQGNAPSRAAILGRAATEDAAQQQLSAQAGARGMGASVAASGAAQAGGAGAMTQATQQALSMRNAEMAEARERFAKGAGAVRGQDIQHATTNAQLEAQQRALNDQRQAAYERMAYDTRLTQMASNQAQNQSIDEFNNQVAIHRNQQSADDAAKVKDYATMTLGGMMLLSDERAKMHTRPIIMGSLSGLAPRGE